MTHDDVFAVMRDICQSAVFSAETDLLECGLDSIELASVLPGCEHRFGIHIDENSIQWRSIRTVQQFADALCRQHG